MIVAAVVAQAAWDDKIIKIYELYDLLILLISIVLNPKII